MLNRSAITVKAKQPFSGECHWSKDYIGKHSVFYEGFGENKAIWGNWSINWSGGFHIWPVGSGEGMEEAEEQEEPIEDTVMVSC